MTQPIDAHLTHLKLCRNYSNQKRNFAVDSDLRGEVQRRLHVIAQAKFFIQTPIRKLRFTLLSSANNRAAPEWNLKRKSFPCLNENA